jgi:hypothetical protein
VPTKSCLAALVFGLLIVHPSFAQPKSNSSVPDQAKDDGAKQSAASSLEDMLAKALKQNPDILVAEAKLRTAEAELNRVRQQVLAKIVDLNAEIVSSKYISKEADTRLTRLKELRSKGGNLVSDEDLGTAQMVADKYKFELSRKEAEMSLLIGKKVALGDKVQPLAISPDGQWLLAEIDGSFRMKNLATDKWVDPKALDLKKSTADKMRAALETQVKVNYNRVPLEEVLEYLQSLVKGVNLYLAGREFKRDSPVTAKLTEPVSLLAALQLLEDTTGLRFIVREYGIVAVDRNNLPPGALSVSDFARQSTEKTTK